MPLPVPEIDIKRGIIYRGFHIPCEIVQARRIIDTEFIDPGQAAKVSYFVSMNFAGGGPKKQDHEANFAGEKALVQKGRYWEAFLLQVVPLATNMVTRFTEDDMKRIGDQGHIFMQDDKETIVDEPLREFMAGVQFVPRAYPGDPFVGSSGSWGTGSQMDVYRFVQPLVVQGGQIVTAYIDFQVEGGIDISTRYKLSWRFLGLELIPTGEGKTKVSEVRGTLSV